MKEILGVFALPRVVLFPGATLPLHVFESRYRRLVEDALGEDRQFAIALLKPGYETSYDGNPDIHPIGCAGRITQVAALPDGRFLLNLVGTERVEFLEMTRGVPYRCCRVRYLSELAPPEDSERTREALLRLVSAYHQLLSAVTGASTAAPVLSTSSFADTVNRIAFRIDVDPSVKYRLLENGDLFARAERLAGLLESALPDQIDLSGHLSN
jgi:Lon protease-like protein